MWVGREDRRKETRRIRNEVDDGYRMCGGKYMVEL